MSQENIHRLDGSIFGEDSADGMVHRAFLRAEGFSADAVRRRPVIGISTSWSELNPCNNGFRELAAAVKRGVEAAGGLALEFPSISINEPFSRPSSMYLRNLMAMDVEETILASPIDGVVLLGACDKTVPAVLMGAISAGTPAVLVTGGPRPVACWEGRDMTVDEQWEVIDRRRVGEVSDEDWRAFEGVIHGGPGSCNVMGTATTMAAIGELLGFALPGSSLPPAAASRRQLVAEASGRLVVDVVARQIVPRSLVTMAALENAVRTTCALGGSTNALIHLEAIAGRAGLRIGVDRLREWSSTTPFITDVKPNGRALLSDLDAAGGIPAVAARIRHLLHEDVPTADGRTWGEVFDGLGTPQAGAPIADPAAPLTPDGGITVVRGTLAPDGAVMKIAGAAPSKRRHRGKAVVFDGVADMWSKIDREDLAVDESSVLVLRGVGVRGGPGIPEVGHVPIPAKLFTAGVTDMLRVTDARMSGTSSGSVVLHVSPEAAVGGPLAYVRDGDEIELDVEQGRLDLLVPPDELARRTPVGASAAPPARGWGRLYARHALQPDEGCDFDFLLDESLLDETLLDETNAGGS
ncbi:dihydroxy-acid dehydratase [Pseudoclavibacter endophyticus]|uniref:Dihydroxy-acid dehydratase n=1 Tax=Pseudoclavibacter endophyticus TaxID=1778590 RepID=A0A6H9WBV4_9MICO|nr:dihydroxy-acid dehydratase [Pseudoclavibacter endophyticus]KAB1648140.1 dihydroxy-acid dehydratase [Pseudoclavibacter endophyticus]GGA70065.1 dihydroxy-acid dehydratase [Pseudoclavibacter endophyticus]